MNRPTTYRCQPLQSTLGVVLIVLEFALEARVDRTRLVVDLSAELFPRCHGLRVRLELAILEETYSQAHNIRLARTNDPRLYILL